MHRYVAYAKLITSTNRSSDETPLDGRHGVSGRCSGSSWRCVIQNKNLPTVLKIDHHHHHLFWKRSFLQCDARLRRLPIWGLSIHPWILPIQDVNQAFSCHHPHTLSKSFYSSPYNSPLPPPPFYRPIPNHPHSYAQMPKPPQSAPPPHICTPMSSREINKNQDCETMNFKVIKSTEMKYFIN